MRIFSKETRKKMSVARLGKPSPRKGCHLSLETKQKISDSTRGKRISSKTIEKYKKYNAKRFSDPAEHEKLSISQLKSWTPERKQKVSLITKHNWENPDIRKKYYSSLAKTKWLKVRTDKGQLELIDKWNRLGFKFIPNYQIHTDNFLGYIDGYDQIHNVVLEYDGKYHSKLCQQKKDLIRQNKIIDILKPKKFWRFDATNKQFRNVLISG